MVKVKWNESLKLSLTEIDEQHILMTEKADFLIESMLSKKSIEEINILFDELLNVSQNHFSLEEDYFEEFNFEETSIHKKEHSAHIKKVTQLKNNYDGAMRSALNTMSYLSDWYKDHVSEYDKKYMDLFKSRGVK